MPFLRSGRKIPPVSSPMDNSLLSCEYAREGLMDAVRAAIGRRPSVLAETVFSMDGALLRADGGGENTPSGGMRTRGAQFAEAHTRRILRAWSPRPVLRRTHTAVFATVEEDGALMLELHVENAHRQRVPFAVEVAGLDGELLVERMEGGGDDEPIAFPGPSAGLYRFRIHVDQGSEEVKIAFEDD